MKRSVSFAFLKINVWSFNFFFLFDFFIVNGWQILLNCLAAYILPQLAFKSCAAQLVNSKSRLLHFDWLFQTFWHWGALLSRCTEPKHAKLIRIFEWRPLVWADGRIYVHLLQSIFYIMQRAGRRPSDRKAFRRAPENSQCSRWPVRHCTVTYWSRAGSPPFGDWAAVFQHDNDPKHTSKTTTALLKKLRVKVMDWPSMSPDLNPIEHLWGILKRKVEERKVSNIHQLRDVVMEEWKRTPVTTCEALVNSMPKRVKAVLENNGGHTKYWHFGPNLDNFT